MAPALRLRERVLVADALYVTLAARLQCYLVTSDLRLARAVDDVDVVTVE